MAQKEKSKYKSITNAKTEKKGEFYTQYEDIQKELNHYEKQFKGKVVLCNCDDPVESQFCFYFLKNFNFLGLKRLICTCYNESPFAFTIFDYLKDDNNKIISKNTGYILDIKSVPMKNGRGVSDEDIENLLKSKNRGVKKLEGDGDFRSEEVIKYLKEADIVCTNPPFYLFREFVAQLIKYKKKFLIIGNMNAITTEEIFPLIKNKKIWWGASIHSGDREFRVPDYYPLEASGVRIDKNGQKFIKVKGVRWYTNIDYKERHEDLPLYKKYNAIEYPKYENFDAINVSSTEEIPKDYKGVMGVPITFMDKYNPNQFEILGCSSCISIFGIKWKEPSDKFFNLLEKGKVRTKSNYQKSKPCWIDSQNYANIGYHRIFIKKINRKEK